MKCRTCLCCTRMFEHSTGSTALNGSPGTSSYSSFARCLNHSVNNSEVPTDKENLSVRLSNNMDCHQLSFNQEISPSKFTVSKNVSRERYPLEDRDPNSQDSGYSNSSSLFSEDSKFSSNFSISFDGRFCSKLVSPSDKFSSFVSPSDKFSSWLSMPTAEPPASSLRGTLFNYGFKKTSVKFQRSFSETDATIKKALQRATSDPNLIGDFSKPFVLPLKIGRITDLKNIDCFTLAKLINGEYRDTVSSYTIIDCRYPYEYEGGHIRGAVNIYTKEQIMDELNHRKLLNESSRDFSCSSNPNMRNILIFHCEFSSERGPSLSRYLRNADREKNSLEYPKLDYPEIYLLEGGYQKFYTHYQELCEPRDYIKMIDPNHSEALRKLKVRSKSWACTRDNRKLRSSYKRLGL